MCPECSIGPRRGAAPTSRAPCAPSSSRNRLQEQRSDLVLCKAGGTSCLHLSPCAGVSLQAPSQQQRAVVTSRPRTEGVGEVGAGGPSAVGSPTHPTSQISPCLLSLPLGVAD